MSETFDNQRERLAWQDKQIGLLTAALKFYAGGGEDSGEIARIAIHPENPVEESSPEEPAPPSK